MEIIYTDILDEYTFLEVMFRLKPKNSDEPTTYRWYIRYFDKHGEYDGFASDGIWYDTHAAAEAGGRLHFFWEQWAA